jgi:hypothetical protein
MTSLIVDPEQPTPEKPDGPNDQNQAPQVPEDDIPEKYRGKNLKDIIAMHQNAESELGRKNNEVGMIRKLADELIGVNAAARAQANQPPARKPLTTDELLDNPEEKILSVVRDATEAELRNRDARLARLEADLQIQSFEKKYPGFQQTIGTPEFGSWIQSGSEYRRGLALKAANGDYGAADELLGLYNEQKGSTPPQAPEPPPSTGARNATLARSGGSVANGVVPGGGDGKKVWNRSELLDMRINRPEEFDLRQTEILQAYAEKRVR